MIMNNELATGLLTYTLIMVIFHFIKDLLLKGHKLTAEQKSKLNKRWLISYGIGLLFMLLLFGCQYEPYEKECVKGEGSPGVTCIEIYDPVCAPDGTTYPNSCYAERDGWDNLCITKGECNE